MVSYGFVSIFSTPTSRQRSNRHLLALNNRADLRHGGDGQASGTNQINAAGQRFPIAQRLLCFGPRGKALVSCRREQLVRGRNDVLDLRAGLRLEERQGVEKDSGVRDPLSRLVQGGKRGAGAGYR